MSKKLVFDRSLSIFAKVDDVVTVPEGEVWKATLNDTGVGGAAEEFKPSNFRPSSADGLDYLIMGAGTKIRSKNFSFITGIAFKIVEI